MPVRHRAERSAISSKCAGGLTLIEVLIMGSILSIGIVGGIALQHTILSNDRDASNRAVATLLVADMAERILNNPDGAQNGDYVVDGSSYTVSASSPCNIRADSGCDSGEVAANDIWEWQAKIKGITQGAVTVSGKITGAVGTVVRDSANRYTVTISWDEEAAGKQGTLNDLIVTQSVVL